jgi:membrane protease YdiL (CAAX protease family)
VEDRGRRLAGALLRLLLFAVLFVVLAVPLQYALIALLRTGGEEATLLATAATAIAATLAGVVLVRWLDHRRAGAIGIAWGRGTALQSAIGLAIGIGAIVCGVVALVLLGFVRYSAEPGTVADWALTLLAHLGIFAVAAYAEEALFRGYPYQVLVRALGAVPATLLLSAGFAFAHARNPNVGTFALINIFLAGVLLSVAYLRTLSLWFATAVHLGWNWGMASLLDLPVSGLSAFETPLYEPAVSGPAWVTGAAFGPEGGLIGTLAFGAALLVTLRLTGLGVVPAQRSAGALVEDRRPKELE